MALGMAAGRNGLDGTSCHGPFHGFERDDYPLSTSEPVSGFEPLTCRLQDAREAVPHRSAPCRTYLIRPGQGRIECGVGGDKAVLR